MQDSTHPQASEAAADDPAANTNRPPASAPPLGSQSKLAGLGWLSRMVVQAFILAAVGAFLLLLLGIAQRTQWVTASGFFAAQGQAGEAAATGGEAKRFICPMMCTPPSTEPGRCPVCAMELVEATGGGDNDGKSVTIQPSARRLVGIQTATSMLGNATRTIQTVGSIGFDESRLSTISAYIDGRLEELYANYVGVQVSEGDDLALIYSPQLYAAQTEYITSLDGGSVGRFDTSERRLNEMAGENLRELGMSDDQISALRESRKAASRIRIKSPRSGTVIRKAAVEGDYIKTGQKIFQIADLTSVWLMVDLFPDDAALVRYGQQVEAEIQSIPGEVFTGRIAFVDPTVNPKTRTVQVRVELLNFDGKLRPGDYASARITVPATATRLVYDPALAGKYISPMHPQVVRSEPGQCPLCGTDLVPTSTLGYTAEPRPEQRVVTVPRDAVLLNGEKAVIYVETEPGRFEIRRITIGPMNDKHAVITHGLAAGETIATAGNFLIDSQMQLAGNPSLLDPTRAPSYAPGPLELPRRDPIMLTGEAADHFDRAYNAYFEIQAALAGDTTPPPVSLSALIDGLTQLELSGSVPDECQRQFAIARKSAQRMDGSLETAREGNRSVSQALLRAANITRGPKTAQSMTHFYCSMVPGGGGDWIQAGGELANPYWGSEMLRCGEVVRDLAVKSESVPRIANAVK